MMLSAGADGGGNSLRKSSPAAESMDGGPLSEVHFHVLDAAYEEFCDLEKRGEKVDPAEFCARYPLVQSSLSKLLHCHRLLDQTLDEEEPNWPRPGQQVADFRIVRELGKGAFSRVYQATEAKMGNRLVALKLSKKGNAEAATLGPLDHPGIVTAYSISHDKATGLWAFCMPYRGSATLHHVLDRLNVLRSSKEPILGRHLLEACRDPFTPASEADADACAGDVSGSDATFSDVLRGLAIQMMRALAFIHDRGIHHRDLKPSNVLLRCDGTPLLIDFNLSADAQRPQSRRGGTPLYMAPEQLESVFGPDEAGIALDHRADLFSLGILLYEVAVGSHPFGPFPFRFSPSEQAALLVERQRRGCPPVGHGCPELDADLARLIDQCLAADPALRPDSAHDAVKRLQRPLPWPRRAARILRRRPKAFLATLLLVAATVMAIAPHLKGPSTAELLNAGQAAFHHGDFDRARHLVSQVIEREPAHARALIVRGHAYVKIGDFHSANNDFLQADQVEANGLTKAWRAYCFQRQDEPRAAIDRFRAAQKWGERSLALLNNLGAAYIDIGDFDSAEKVLHQALEIGPKVQAVHHNLALTYMKKGVRDEGESPQFFAAGARHAEAALALGPASAELLFDCASAHALRARQDPLAAASAIARLKEALRQGHDPTYLDRMPPFTAIQKEVKELMQSAPAAKAPASKAFRLLEPALSP